MVSLSIVPTPIRRTAVLGIIVVVAACGGATGNPDGSTASSSAASSAPASGDPASSVGPSASSATASEPAASAAALEGDDATRTVALLDDLAALEDPTLEQLVDWFDRAYDDRLQDETIPVFFAYVMAREQLFQAVQNGESIKQPMADLLDTRNPIAALAGIAAATPRATAAPTPKPDRADYAKPSKAEWAAIIADPEAHLGERYVIASCIATPVALDAMLGQSWPTWRVDYWEGNETAFSSDEETIMAIAGSSTKRIDAYVTVAGTYALDFRGGELVPHFQLDDVDPPRGCME